MVVEKELQVHCTHLFIQELSTPNLLNRKTSKGISTRFSPYLELPARRSESTRRAGEGESFLDGVRGDTLGRLGFLFDRLGSHHGDAASHGDSRACETAERDERERQGEVLRDGKAHGSLNSTKGKKRGQGKSENRR